MNKLRAILSWLRLRLTTRRYYVVEFAVEARSGVQVMPALHRIELFGGCPDTGVFTRYRQAFTYYQWRQDDITDVGFEYRLVQLREDNELVQTFIKLKGEVAHGFQ